MNNSRAPESSGIFVSILLSNADALKVSKTLNEQTLDSVVKQTIVVKKYHVRILSEFIVFKIVAVNINNITPTSIQNQGTIELLDVS